MLHFENNGLIPGEQKNNRVRSKGTKDKLLIVKMVLRNVKRRKIILRVTCIDHKISFRLIPFQLDCEEHSNNWYQVIRNNIRQFLKTAINSWNMLLTVNN